MGVQLRLVALATLAILTLAPASPADAEVLVRRASLSKRRSLGGEVQLLVSVPEIVDSLPVDEVRLKLGGKTVRGLTPIRIRGGWTSKVEKDRVILSAPELGRLSSDYAGVGAYMTASYLARLEIPDESEVELRGGGKRLFKSKLPIGQLPQVEIRGSLDGILRFPQVIVRDEPVTFRPLSLETTPAGGEWRVGDHVAEWNGDWTQPSYRFTPSAALQLPVHMRYEDPWGEPLVDAPAEGVRFADANPGAIPTITGCAPNTLVGKSICVCGSFPTEESRTAIYLNGQSLAEHLLSGSSAILNFQLPPDLKPGPLSLVGQESAGYGPSDTASSKLIGVGGDVDRNKLLRGDSTPLRLWLVGTDEPLSLRLWNTTPQIISLVGGNDQIVTTSGGATNEVVKTVNAVSPGDFVLHYALKADCPCADAGASAGSR